MRVLVLALLAASVFAQTSVSGSFAFADGASMAGSISIQLTTPTVTNTCGTAKQAITFRPVTAKITGGAMVATPLYASNCLSTGVSAAASVQSLSGAGVGASVSVGGSWYGTLTVLAGTSPAPDASVARIALTIPPFLSCYVQTANANAIAANATYSDTTVTRARPTQIGRYLTLTVATSLTAGLTYQWTYSCIQPYSVSVYDTLNNLMYTAKWAVPIGSTADVTAVDLSELVVLSK